eukprot:COSAG01_NODE_68471_length_264_cov_0.618182_1_plen_77_part_10
MPPKVAAQPEGATAPEADEPKKGGGCCCCRGKVAPEGPVQVTAAFHEQSKCHDTPWCLVFLAYWVGMVVIFIYAATN